jgi:branched-chain amino acid transport system permease protein
MSDAQQPADEQKRRELLGVQLTTRQWASVGIVVLIALLLPDLADLVTIVPYRSVINGLTFGFAAVGVAMLLRYLGLVSFGHAAFFGAGAYTVAVMTSYLEISNIFLLLIGSVLVSVVLAFIVGYLVKGHLAIFFALLTLAFNQILYAVVQSTAFFNYTDGLGVRIGGQRPDLFGVQMGLDVYNLFLHYLTIFLLGIIIYVAWKIGRSPFGRTIKAIGQNRTRASFIGIDVERYVLATFVITGLFTGLGGGLYALFELHIRPDPTLHIFRSGEMLFMAILGGIETLIGPVVGSVILTYLLDTMHVITDSFDLLIGIILVAVVFLLPEGLLTLSFGDMVESARDISEQVRSRLR